MKEIHIDGESVTIEDVVAVARNNAEVIIPKTVEKKVLQCRNFLEKCVQNKKIIYGVTTGFGALSNLYLPADKNKQLQLNLVRSHSASVGKLLDTDIVRAMMLLRANSLAKGYSGIRTTTLHQLVEFLNRRVHPLIPEKGSVG
ncbi:MAG: aromatic amino acid lyase, partial [Promethearchaeota archaeon]